MKIERKREAAGGIPKVSLSDIEVQVLFSQFFELHRSRVLKEQDPFVFARRVVLKMMEETAAHEIAESVRPVIKGRIGEIEMHFVTPEMVKRFDGFSISAVLCILHEGRKFG